MHGRDGPSREPKVPIRASVHLRCALSRVPRNSARCSRDSTGRCISGTDPRDAPLGAAFQLMIWLKKITAGATVPSPTKIAVGVLASPRTLSRAVKMPLRVPSSSTKAERSESKGGGGPEGVGEVKAVCPSAHGGVRRLTTYPGRRASSCSEPGRIGRFGAQVHSRPVTGLAGAAETEHRAARQQRRGQPC